MLFEQVDSITPKIIEQALNGLSLRHEAIASNIANLNTVGYRPISVSFESQLANVQRAYSTGGNQGSAFEISPIVTRGKKQASAVSNSNIDANTVMLNQNVIQYHALIKGMQHYMGMLSIAVKEGRN
jgi:flagellar basal-body rod protein FlgB